VNSEKNPLISSENLINVARRIAHMGGWAADLRTGRMAWCDTACSILQIPQDTPGTINQALQFFPLPWRSKIMSLFATAVRCGSSFDQELELLTVTGRMVSVRLIGESVRDSSGKIIRIQGAVQDISEHKASIADALRVTAQLKATLESITDAFLMVDRDWNFTYLNSQAERLLGCKQDEVIGTNIWAKFPEAIGGPYYIQYHRAVRENCTVAFEEYYPPLDLWTEIRAYPSEEGLSIYFLDIGERKAIETKLRRLGHYDSLTDLPNRRLLVERLEHVIKVSQRNSSFGAVLFVDLDNFKLINDASGHDRGDQHLRIAASRLKEALRASDTVARVGGDEFVVLLEELATTEATLVEHAKLVMNKILSDFQQPFLIDGEEHYTTASIGAAIFTGQSVTAEEILKRADLAMYEAKAAGRNAAVFFDKRIAARVKASFSLKAELLQAFAKHEFVLYYQPQVDLAGKITGVEALVRWNHPQRGLVSPGEFIPFTEENGLILPLGQWVLTAACLQLKKWATHTKTEHLTIAVNVSAHQIRRPDFVDLVLKTIGITDANPRRLKLELTESVLVDDVEGTISKMLLLQGRGIGFALDDFGTGYSSLSYLYRLPLDQLKIDQSFVRDAVSQPHSATIARAIVALGKALNLAVIAEGVETVEQYAFISGEGCSGYQGYLFSEPLSEEKIQEFLFR
jgi:diguanylate cyclase (GGDEF)-like protein/PAS domain S-box-containing protein